MKKRKILGLGLAACLAITSLAAPVYAANETTAAVTETALSRGADLLFLREQAIRAGIASARFCSQEEWHDLLCSADCSITLNLQKSPEYDAFAP